jgi:hypothetical protein
VSATDAPVNVPSQEDEPLEQQALEADTAAAQRELIYYELWRLRREMLTDPGLEKVTIGQGGAANPEHTIRGDPRDPYNGVTIFNPTAATISIGFQAGLAYLAPIVVPPFTWLAAPQRYTNLSIAVLNPQDAAQTYTLPVTAVRTRVPPMPGAGPYGSPSEGKPAIAAVNPGSTTTVGAAGEASIVTANSLRRKIVISNPGATGWITLGLSTAIPAMWAGIPLAPNGGVWEEEEWDGPVSAIAAANGTEISIVEW